MVIIQGVAELDCLQSLLVCRKNLCEPVCRPEFIDSDISILELRDSRHPFISTSIDQEYIPNDIYLGNEDSKMILLTGPNMGGKSSLLRQTCVAVIMAQMGCYIPAASCRLTPCDRIFTRIGITFSYKGANDNIMAGQSTFMVELSETSKILREATPRSLVILDELGRGTSTFDGYAIAYAVLHHLITETGCLGLFSTHYGTLTKEFEDNPMVSLKYMSFLVDQNSRKVTFLYKLLTGICRESYGMNVARMASIPEQVPNVLTKIINRAEVIAQQFESTHSSSYNQDRLKLHHLASFNEILRKSKQFENIWNCLQ